MCCLNLADKAQVRVTERLKSMQATQDSPDTRLVGTAKLRQAHLQKKNTLLRWSRSSYLFCLASNLLPHHKKPQETTGPIGPRPCVF